MDQADDLVPKDENTVKTTQRQTLSNESLFFTKRKLCQYFHLLLFRRKDLCEAKHKTASVFNKGRRTPPHLSNLELQSQTTLNKFHI